MRFLKKIYWFIIKTLPFTRCLYETRYTQTPITLRYIFFQKIIGFNKLCYWQVHHSSVVTNPENIIAGIETSPGMMPGCYIQGKGKVIIGDYTQIAANVGIISSNHMLNDSRKHIISEVEIGKYCWLGMGSIILPGVKLGDFTVVAAGAIVTKSFSEGYCVIGGNPAKVLKKIDHENCHRFESEYKYNGYIKNSDFKRFRKRNLNF